VIIMQRLHEHDLCSYLIGQEPGKWTVISLPCIYTDDDGNEKALWEDKHTLEELRNLQKVQPFVFETQYMQNPRPLEGLMYHDFKTYEIIPRRKDVKHCCCIDTADTGADYLCAVFYDELPDGNYVTDVYYTKKPMEVTEFIAAEKLNEQKTDVCFIESNNGGRGFARNVERRTRELGNTHTWIVPYTQTQNKQVRIFTQSADVNNMTIFPADWKTRWQEFATALGSYRKEGGNAHDDAPDCCTMCFEKRGESDYYDPDVDEQLLNDML